MKRYLCAFSAILGIQLFCSVAAFADAVDVAVQAVGNCSSRQYTIAHFSIAQCVGQQAENPITALQCECKLLEEVRTSCEGPLDEPFGRQGDIVINGLFVANDSGGTCVVRLRSEMQPLTNGDLPVQYFMSRRAAADLNLPSQHDEDSDGYWMKGSQTFVIAGTGTESSSHSRGTLYTNISREWGIEELDGGVRYPYLISESSHTERTLDDPLLINPGEYEIRRDLEFHHCPEFKALTQTFNAPPDANELIKITGEDRREFLHDTVVAPKNHPRHYHQTTSLLLQWVDGRRDSSETPVEFSRSLLTKGGYYIRPAGSTGCVESH